MFKTSKTIISASLIPIGLKLTKLTKNGSKSTHKPIIHNSVTLSTPDCHLIQICEMLSNSSILVTV